jgi:small subunit ribosomal protein S2
MAAVRIRDLIEAGAHFGHPVSRWHPKMEPYIYGKRNLIHIIDLRQTVRGILRARHFLRSVTEEGGKVLFVGTKRQAKATISALAPQVGMPFVSERWPGGMLTNFQTVRSRLKRLEELETLEADGTINRYSKKMISSMRREKRKILRNLDGVRTMTELPAAVLVVDPRHELIAVKESRTLNIPTVAVIDTDCNPELVDIPVPANDDAFRSVQMILTSLAESIGEGAAMWEEKLAVARKLEEQKEEAARKIKEARELARRQAQAAKAEKAAKPEPPKKPTSSEGADKPAQEEQPAAPAGESTAPGSS